jgi:glycosyltransferase involved in cell wall biosynthesis
LGSALGSFGYGWGEIKDTLTKLLIVTTIPITLKAFLLPFAQHFKERGWQVDAMANGIDNCEACKETFDHVWEVRWSRNPLDPRALMNAPKQIEAIVGKEKYDIVHVHTPVAAFITRFALRKLRKVTGTRVIYTAHGFHFHQQASLLRNFIYLLLERFAGKYTDYLVVINRDDYHAANRYRIVSGGRLRYIPGIGVDTAFYHPESVSGAQVCGIREELEMQSADKLFLMIGEFNPGKRHTDLIRAWAKMNRQDVHIAFAGTGPGFQKVKEQVIHCGWENRLHFLGFRADIPALIKTAIAVVLPSEREGLPRSVMESLSLGVPVIGTDIRGIRDLLEGECGILVKLGDTGALAGAMQWVLDHPAEAVQMGENGRRKMCGDYEIMKIIKAHEDLYQEALGASSSWQL